MATQALYRRWRSQTFAEIIGQEHVTQTLLNALRAGRIAHAYLFTGPRGTGKTTTARVLAKAVNCLDSQNGEPCNHCAICRSINEARSLDLFEIDGASNNSVDDVRDLREKISFAPSECRYKVYVVDEVHMLSDSAFNALLKTLEEPPPHAIFVLATTEPHKIPATVLSRCQRFDFRRVSVPNLRNKLDLICNREGVSIEPAALDAIARYAAGSFRDAESLLDQLMSYGSEQIQLRDVRRVLGSAPEEIVVGLVQATITGDAGSGLNLINEALDSGVEPRQLTREVLEYLRNLLLLRNGGAALLSVTPELLSQMTEQAAVMPLGRLLQTIRLFNGAFGQLKAGLHTQLPLEMALVEATLLAEQPASKGLAESNPAQPASSKPVPAPSAARARPPSAPAEEAAAPPAQVVPLSAPSPGPEMDQVAEEKPAPENPGSSPATVREAEPAAASQELGHSWLEENWGPILQAVRTRSKVVEALLKSCEPLSVQDDLVTLGFYHSFHRERMGEDKNRTVVEEALTEVSGRPLRVKCALCTGDRQQKEQETEAKRREKLLENPVVSEAIRLYGARVKDVQ